VNLVDPSGHQATCYFMGYSGITCTASNADYAAPPMAIQSPPGLISPTYSNYFGSGGSIVLSSSPGALATSTHSSSASGIQMMMVENQNKGKTGSNADGGEFGNPNPVQDPKWISILVNCPKALLDE
jgi:hypothetical protein